MFSVNTKPIKVYSQHKTFTYMGHTFIDAREYKQQVDEMVSDYSTSSDLINASALPLMHLETIRQKALVKVPHLQCGYSLQVSL